MDKGSDIFSHILVIKKIYFSVEFPSGPKDLNRVCDNLIRSGKFKDVKQVDKEVFTDHFREPNEVSRTIETTEAFEVLNLDLLDARLSGELRLLLTIYRAGFVVVSLFHSVIPQRKDGEPKGKNLTADKPLSSHDIVFLIEEGTPDRAKSLKYRTRMQDKEHEMETNDIVEHLLRSLEAQDIIVRRSPKTNANVIQCWNPDFSATFQELLQMHCQDLYLVFTTPQPGRLKKQKKEVLEKLKSCVFWSSKDRGFLFSKNSMLIVSPVFQEPNRLVFAKLPWIFQLATMQFFMLQFYSEELRRTVFETSAMVLNEPDKLLTRVSRLMSSFSLALEDLYWVEGDLFRLQSAHFIAEYKKQFELDEKLKTLQKRFEQIEERCIEARTTLQQRTEKEREKNITYLTTIFATFGLGEILSNFVVWYFSYRQSNDLPISVPVAIAGLMLPFLAICLLYLASRAYIGSKYKKSETA